MISAAFLIAASRATPDLVPFPRVLAESREAPSTASEFGFIETAKQGSEADAAFRMLSSVFAPSREFLFNGEPMPPVPPGSRRSIFDVVEWERIHGVGPRPPFQEIDTSLLGFQEIRFEFSLEGLILGFRIGLFGTASRRAIYQEFRGYWEECTDGRVFWGEGARIRYNIDTLWTIFTGTNSKAYSKLAKPGKFGGWNTKPDDLVYEVYGDDEKKTDYERSQHGHGPGPLEKHVLDHCHADALGQNEAADIMVEPIYIQSTRNVTNKLVNS